MTFWWLTLWIFVGLGFVSGAIGFIGSIAQARRARLLLKLRHAGIVAYQVRRNNDLQWLARAFAVPSSVPPHLVSILRADPSGLTLQRLRGEPIAHVPWASISPIHVEERAATKGRSPIIAVTMQVIPEARSVDFSILGWNWGSWRPEPNDPSANPLDVPSYREVAEEIEAVRPASN